MGQAKLMALVSSIFLISMHVCFGLWMDHLNWYQPNAFVPDGPYYFAPLYCAMCDKNRSLVIRLLQAGANPYGRYSLNNKTTILAFAKLQNLELVEVVEKYLNDPETPKIKIQPNSSCC